MCRLIENVARITTARAVTTGATPTIAAIWFIVIAVTVAIAIRVAVAVAVAVAFAIIGVTYCCARLHGGNTSDATK